MMIPEYCRCLELLGVDDSFVAEFYEYATLDAMYASKRWKSRRLQIDFAYKILLLQKAKDGLHPSFRVDLERDVIPEHKALDAKKSVTIGFD